MHTIPGGNGGRHARRAARLLLAYADGSRSDRIGARRVQVSADSGEIVLTLELTARPGARELAGAAALRELAEKQFALESLRVTRPGVVAQLRRELRHTGNEIIRVRLLAPGVQVDYPGCAAFNRGAVTLSFG